MPQLIATTFGHRRLLVNLPFEMQITTEDELMLRAGWFWQKEPETLSWINSFERDAVFWDIGANVGCYSLFCAVMHPDSRIFAFEPLSGNYEALCKNISMNRLPNIIALFLALGETTGDFKFAAEKSGAGSSGGQLSKETGDPIKCVAGNDFAISNGMPNYVKIDVDGIESQILSGMDIVLANHNLRGVLVEMNDLEEIEKTMIANGFKRHDKFNSLKKRKSDKNLIWYR